MIRTFAIIMNTVSAVRSSLYIALFHSLLLTFSFSFVQNLNFASDDQLFACFLYDTLGNIDGFGIGTCACSNKLNTSRRSIFISVFIVCCICKNTDPQTRVNVYL